MRLQGCKIGKLNVNVQKRFTNVTNIGRKSWSFGTSERTRSRILLDEERKGRITRLQGHRNPSPSFLRLLVCSSVWSLGKPDYPSFPVVSIPLFSCSLSFPLFLSLSFTVSSSLSLVPLPLFSLAWTRRQPSIQSFFAISLLVLLPCLIHSSNRLSITDHWISQQSPWTSGNQEERLLYEEEGRK